MSLKGQFSPEPADAVSQLMSASRLKANLRFSRGKMSRWAMSRHPFVAILSWVAITFMPTLVQLPGSASKSPS
jgi:hypothetical protein